MDGPCHGPYYGPGIPPRPSNDGGWEFGLLVYIIFLGAPAALFALGVGGMVVRRAFDF